MTSCGFWRRGSELSSFKNTDFSFQKRGEEYFIREMKREDIDHVASIAAGDPFNPWTKEMFLGEWLVPNSYRFLLFHPTEDGRATLLGYICFRIIEEESELLNIAVVPEHRQRGFGRTLMEFYIDFCHQKGVKKYYLEVHPENVPALHLYRGFRYQQTGRRKRFYHQADALVLER